MKRTPLASAEPLVEAWFASGSSKTPLLVLGFGPPDKDPPLHSWFEPGDTDPPVHCRFAANIVSNRGISPNFLRLAAGIRSPPRQTHRNKARVTAQNRPEADVNHPKAPATAGYNRCDAPHPWPYPPLHLMFLVCLWTNEDPPRHSWFAAALAWTPLLVLHLIR